MKYLMMVQKEFPKSDCFVTFEKRCGIEYIISIRVGDYRTYRAISIFELEYMEEHLEKWVEHEINEMIYKIKVVLGGG